MYDLNTCPTKLVTEASVAWLRLYRFFRRGFLPFSGGLLEQPARFLDAMEVIDGASAESEVRDHGGGQD